MDSLTHGLIDLSTCRLIDLSTCGLVDLWTCGQFVDGSVGRPCANVAKGGYSTVGSGGKYTVSAASAISTYAGTAAVVVQGCPDAHCTDTSGFAEAVAAAKAADVVVLAIGIDGNFEGENGDFRAFSPDGIALPGNQAALVAAVAEAAAKPVVVIVSGSSVDLAPIKVCSSPCGVGPRHQCFLLCLRPARRPPPPRPFHDADWAKRARPTPHRPVSRFGLNSHTVLLSLSLSPCPPFVSSVPIVPSAQALVGRPSASLNPG